MRSLRVPVRSVALGGVAIAALVLLVLPLLAGRASAPPEEVLFRADFSPAAAPTFGFDAVRDRYLGKAYVHRTHPGAGPGGRDAVEIAMLGVAGPEEHYNGWYVDLPGDVEQGEAIYIHVLMRILGPVRLESVGNPDSWSTKMVILGDEGESSQRVMWNLRSVSSTRRPAFVIEKNIDGGETRISVDDLDVDTWIHATLEVQSSKTVSSGDGFFALYLGESPRKGSPKERSGRFSLATADFTRLLGLGYYCDFMREGGSIAYQFAGFEVSRRFEPSWRK